MTKCGLSRQFRKGGDIPPFSFAAKSSGNGVSAGMPFPPSRAHFYGLALRGKNTVFPLTLGRAALFRQLAFCLFQRQNILKPAEGCSHLHGQRMGRSQQEGDEAFYIFGDGPPHGGQAHSGIAGFRVVEDRRAHGQDVERIFFK